MKIIYRPIEPQDNLPLFEMIKNVFVEYKADHHPGTIYSDPTTNDLHGLFQIPQAICWVALLDDEVVGCCGIYPTAQLAERTAELVKFYLKASARGIGIGKKLMAKCIESAQVMGYNQLYLESLPEFKNAVAMYERANFAYLDQPLGNSGHFGCNIWMVKQL
jgi:putative acetyltransferase